MARTEARIHTSIWRDPDWRERSVHAQWLYELLLSQPTVSFCGVLGLMPTRWAKMAKGMTPAKVQAHLKELEDARYVVVDYDTEEVWIRSFVKWDGVLDQPALTTSMMKDFAAIQSAPIRDGFLDGLGDGFLEGLPERFPKWFGGDKERVIPDEFLEGSRERATRARTSAGVPLSPSPSPIPAPPPQPSVELAVCEPQALTPDRPPQAVVQVFETWLAVTGRTNQTLLDAKRRRLIDRALKDYPLEDVLDAVAGWRRSPHHRGENDSRTVYNDLELLLRDAAHLEKFRDLERQAPSTNGTPRVTAGEQAIDRVFAQLPRGAA